MKKLYLAVALLALAGGAPAATITPLYAHDLPDIAGKEGSMLTVALAPGEISPVHRHNANVFVYVLSGTVIMQVKDGPRQTLHAGQTFYEAPSDIHVLGSNASKTRPARFIVFFVKDKGAPPVVPVP